MESLSLTLHPSLGEQITTRAKVCQIGAIRKHQTGFDVHCFSTNGSVGKAKASHLVFYIELTKSLKNFRPILFTTLVHRLGSISDTVKKPKEILYD